MVTTRTTDDTNPVVYSGVMADSLNSLRDELRALALDYEKVPELNERRFQLVEQARGQGMTWRAIADILHMTQNGLIKTQQAMRERAAASD